MSHKVDMRKSTTKHAKPKSNHSSPCWLQTLVMSHSDLVKVAKKWLLGTAGCGYVITELVSNALETPDAIGFRSDYSILVECKTARSDFIADQKKLFRQRSEQGIGDFRFYLCEPEIIKSEELPAKWGLLYYDGKQVKKIVAPKGNIWWKQKEFIFEKSYQKEYQIMYSQLRRMTT